MLLHGRPGVTRLSRTQISRRCCRRGAHGSLSASGCVVAVEGCCFKTLPERGVRASCQSELSEDVARWHYESGLPEHAAREARDMAYLHLHGPTAAKGTHGGRSQAERPALSPELSSFALPYPCRTSVGGAGRSASRPVSATRSITVEDGTAR